VLFGTDVAPNYVGIPVTFTFDFHHDIKSDELPVSSGTSDSSNWVCGPRTYTVVGTIPTASSFVSVIDSPTASTLVKPVLSAMTGLDSDIGTFLVELKV